MKYVVLVLLITTIGLFLSELKLEAIASLLAVIIIGVFAIYGHLKDRNR